jgi:hypothetical protein
MHAGRRRNGADGGRTDHGRCKQAPGITGGSADNRLRTLIVLRDAGAVPNPGNPESSLEVGG